MFDTILGLPMHPLIVHAIVVLLPLSALSLIIGAFVPRWQERFGTLSMALLTVAALGSIVAKESGEALAHHIGEPEEHAEWADRLVPLAIGLWVLAVIWWVLQRRATSGATRIVGFVTALVAVAALVVTSIVGHTGAEATWGDAISESANAQGGDGDAKASTTPTSSATTSPSATSSGIASPSTSPSASASTSPTAPATPAGITMAQVAQHADASSCWSAINGNVYNLTSWVDKHPGGRKRILRLCGKDGTDGFTGEHKGEPKPEQMLASFKVGKLAS